MDLEYFPAELSHMTGDFHLGSMTRDRVRSILKEIAVCGLCLLERTKIVINNTNLNNWKHFSECIDYDLKNKDQRWSKLDGFLSERHDLYKNFDEITKGSLHDKAANLKDVVARSFSKPTASVLIEWGLRLNKIQQSLIDEDIIYPTHKVFKRKNQNVEIFRKALIDFYVEKTNEAGIETISLPYLAEKICSSLRITRSDFKDLLKDFYAEYPFKIWLGTGTIQTYAYESFVMEEQSILDVFGEGPWFLKTFYYDKVDRPQYDINKIPRRFIKIERELWKDVANQNAH